jgi:hypothetical protein
LLIVITEMKIMKTYINKKTIPLSIVALLTGFALSYASDERVAIESGFTIKKCGEVSLAKEGKKDIKITIDKSKLLNPKYLTFWIEDSNGEVVKTVVPDEDKSDNKLEKIKDRIEIAIKNFSLKPNGLSPGAYRIHARKAIYKELMHVINKTEIVS